jgi:hypothetical protein
VDGSVKNLQNVKKIITLFLTLIVVNVTFLILVLSVAQIDSKRMYSNYNEGIKNSYTGVLDYPKSIFGSNMDRYTDCVQLSRLKFEFNPKSVVTNVGILNPTLESCEQLSAQDNDISESNIVYLQRYWLGTSTLLKLFTNFSDFIYKFNTLVFILIVIGLALLFSYLRDKYGIIIASTFLILFLVTSSISDVELNYSLSLPTSLILILGYIISRFKFEVLVFSIITGSIISFFDTFVMIGFGAAAFGIFFLNNNFKSYLKILGMYYCGYFGTWIIKWVIVYIISPAQFSSIVNAIVFRGSNRLPDGSIVSAWESLSANVSEFLKQNGVSLIWLLIFLIMLLGSFTLATKFENRVSTQKGIKQILLTLVLVPLEFMIIINHSFWHQLIYSRLLSISFCLFVLLGMVVLKDLRTVKSSVKSFSKKG